MDNPVDKIVQTVDNFGGFELSTKLSTGYPQAKFDEKERRQGIPFVGALGAPLLALNALAALT